MAIKLCRYQRSDGRAGIALLSENEQLVDLTAAGVETLTELVEGGQPSARLQTLLEADLPQLRRDSVQLLPPIERQEVWAAGVTYLRSKKARMDESDFSASAYDRVYEAPRPELFFKASPEKVVSPGGAVGIRRDSRWSVPEPELALVISPAREIVGYTIGNDMSARDIEGENVLYLPQAKIYQGSCALGPVVTVGVSEPEARGWTIHLEIRRGDHLVVTGETSVGQIKRSFDELVEYLSRSQAFPNGAVLLTGTGIVPPDDFTLEPGDLVRITISGIGTLENRVMTV